MGWARRLAFQGGELPNGIRAFPRGLTGRLVIIGLAQFAVLTVVAVVIAVITFPHLPRPHRSPPGLVLSPDKPPSRTGLGRHPLPTPPLVGPVVTLLAGIVVVGVGGYLTARWIVRPLLALQKTVRAVAAGDLSARVAMNRCDEIGEVARAFDEMTERITTMLRSERELLANVSHELRTPLSRIRVAMDLANEGDNHIARAALADIDIDLAELESMINDILIAARLDWMAQQPNSALLRLAPTEITPARLIGEAVERIRTYHSERPVTLSVAPDLPKLRADARLLRRTVDNILENAHKYSPNPQAPIDVNAVQYGGDLVLQISDRGMGIAADELPHIFKPFFRSERSRSREAGGVGLGLALARRIVEAHNGTISAESTLAVGTRITITLPLV